MTHECEASGKREEEDGAMAHSSPLPTLELWPSPLRVFPFWKEYKYFPDFKRVLKHELLVNLDLKFQK